ncbi:MAG: endolytic transglycosylase MltG [Oceanibaculum nanhaiense]|uniref:endolytic transglycosylase MltG n=1 Tax=Oceanibaculum nanhaiense TaxID=1909734 RepID=UPI0025A3B078|nr:endolytic transglycosylase MltG [Oceanibaculum nanhaiense]MDM7946861.1 endolytic transglycosylase MltG [Oceanibaculum nanhaiense]
MGRLLSGLLTFLLLAMLAGGGLLVWGYAQFTRPGPLQTETALVIPRGSGVEGIARRLEQAGILRYPELFMAAVKLKGVSGALKAGEYAFKPGISPREVMALLQSGETVVRRLTIAEGLTVRQIAAQLAAVEGLDGDPAPLPPEGALLPETYHFSYGDERADILRRMQHAMRETLDRLWESRAPNLPFDTREEALVLASIVERETAIPSERPRVAAVFVNRLRKGMRLQSDPTVIYGLSDGLGTLDRPLLRVDLQKDHPYNTYTRDGLPPAPICNPGRDSLRAVLNPITSDEYYFVADGSGGHAFARTLDEHNANVRRWRQFQREQRQ